MILDLLMLTDVQPYASIVDCILGLVTGALLTGLLYSSNYMSKLHAAKIRLFQHKKTG